jgi:hypothetical protein
MEVIWTITRVATTAGLTVFVGMLFYWALFSWDR